MDTAQETLDRSYDVGGVRLARPFRVQRLGHFGFNVANQETALRFYSDLLGLPVTDTVNFGQQFNVASATGQDPHGYFLRVGADHHSVVLFPHWAFAASGQPKREGTTWISHMAWQVGTLREVVEGRRWLTEKQTRIARPGGRDQRGANWNFTVTDADAISNEIYYGMDQIGWDGVSKPVAICPRNEPLPAPDGAAEPDFPMARAAIEGGLDLRQGLHQRPFGAAKYDVAGIMLPRPFRVVRNGPIRLFARDVDAASRFYAETMGLAVTEEANWQGHRCVFLRANTEHHTVALYPLALRDELGMRADSICMAYGMQVGSYRQLKDAVSFLDEHGVTIRYLPPELSPGIDYSAYALDPEGHAIQLYYYMEQIGWDGKPRPATARRKIDNADWPDTLDALSDTYAGPVFQGPIG
ncbi:MAG TPA: VOC family protein [Stellaceae bacterium]|nr:VOC family protein [Stellaceae bacterium]